MPWDIPELMGSKVLLDGRLFEIRGVVPNVPLSVIEEGQLIELLVIVV